MFPMPKSLIVFFAMIASYSPTMMKKLVNVGCSMLLNPKGFPTLTNIPNNSQEVPTLKISLKSKKRGSILKY
jgi:hypothetical protein